MQIKHECFYRQTMEMMRRNFKATDVADLFGKYETEFRNSANALQQRNSKVTTKTINLVSNVNDELERGLNMKESVRNSDLGQTTQYTNTSPDINTNLDLSGIGLESDKHMESLDMGIDLQKCLDEVVNSPLI